MKYTRNEIDKAGRIITSSTFDLFDYAEAVVKIDDWRKLHLPVVELLSDNISKLLAGNGIHVAFSSQRLKRMTSIKEKLMRLSTMGLGGVQDIGGARFVFDDMESLLKAKDCIAKVIFPNFSLDHDLYDYINQPKESGYRSMHFVYRYSKPESEWDGMRVELQIRTRLQHDWATAVETAELISQSSLKASLGDQTWLDFFKLVSAIFARKENQPVNTCFKELTEKQYCTLFNKMNNKHKFVDNLNALVGVVNLTEQQSFTGGYVLLVINYEEKKVRIRHFKQDEKDSANEQYAQIENRVDKAKEAVVLVAVSDVKELREAYSSYFLNSKEFVDELSGFQYACHIRGYI